MAFPLTCPGSSKFSSTPLAALSGFGSPSASHHTTLILLYPGIWRMEQSRGCSGRGWTILRSPSLPTPSPNAIISAPRPSCTALCSCTTRLRIAKATSCHIGGIVGGGGCPTTLWITYKKVEKEFSKDKNEAEPLPKWYRVIIISNTSGCMRDPIILCCISGMILLLFFSNIKVPYVR